MGEGNIILNIVESNNDVNNKIYTAIMCPQQDGLGGENLFKGKS
jgi:hypothetical protein